VIRRTEVVVLFTFLTLVTAGCVGDKSESIRLPSTLAVGAYGELVFGDSCSGSKADLCFNDKVESVEAMTVVPPQPLEILPASEVPTDLLELWGYKGDYVVHGLAPGHTTVCVQAKYSDGTHRKACAGVDVGAIARVALQLSCEITVGNATPAPLVVPGRALQFQVQLFAADGSALGGVFSHPIEDGQLLSGGVPMTYFWASPAAGGSLTLRSSLDPNFIAKLETYGPAQVTNVVVYADLLPPTVLGVGRQLEIQVAEDVGGARSCQGLPVMAKTETPDVCRGPNGELVWSESGGSGTSFTAVSEGSCRLSVGVVGGKDYPGTITVPYYFVNPADQGRESTIDAHCQVQGQRNCEADRSAILVCTSRRTWAVASSCNGKLCDYTAPAPCPAESECVACR
jgi:hypothetical protein